MAAQGIYIVGLLGQRGRGQAPAPRACGRRTINIDIYFDCHCHFASDPDRHFTNQPDDSASYGQSSSMRATHVGSASLRNGQPDRPLAHLRAGDFEIRGRGRGLA